MTFTVLSNTQLLITLLMIPVADVSGNGAAFPDVLKTKGQEDDGATEEKEYFPFE